MEVDFLRPVDHFDGTQRLLVELKQCLNSASFSELNLAVAFAKSGPLLRLSNDIENWRKNGKTAKAVIGISHRGTSLQALQLALELFDEVFIPYPGHWSTFHPKLYLFSGNSEAVCFYGSHNLTVGGTETNLEGGVKVSFS